MVDLSQLDQYALCESLPAHGRPFEQGRLFYALTNAYSFMSSTAPFFTALLRRVPSS